MGAPVLRYMSNKNVQNLRVEIYKTLKEEFEEDYINVEYTVYFEP